MAGTTPLTGAPYPFGSDSVVDLLSVDDFALYIEKYVNMRFASTAARDAAIPIPDAGMQCVVGTGTSLEIFVYTGAAWQSMYSAGGWVNLTLTAGYSAVAGHTPQIRRVGQLVRVRGMVTFNSGTITTAVSTVPAAYIPVSNEWLGLTRGTTGSWIASLLVDPTGGISCPSATYYQGTAAAGMAFSIAGNYLIG
jgi:hypothetical protein